MRWFWAALISLASIGAAAADIRVDVSRYANGELTVSGQTEPHRTVTMDNKYKTQSDAKGTFKFSIKQYRPPNCMSDIRSGSDSYSAVIAGCFGDSTVPTPKLLKPPP